MALGMAEKDDGFQIAERIEIGKRDFIHIWYL